MHPLTQRVASIKRRLTLWQAVAAACRVAAAVVAAVLVLGAVDYMVRYQDAGLRVLATAAVVSVTLWAIYRWWYLPRRRKLTTLSVARQIESRFPQLNDSLASAIEFLEQSEDAGTAGSPQLRRLVVAEVQTTVESLPLDEVIDPSPIRRALAWLAAVLLAVALCLAWDAAAVRTAVARLMAPLGSAEWPRQHHLAFRDPPSRLAAGQTFEVELVNRTGELPDEAYIEYRTARGERRREPMIRAGDVMVARKENVRVPFAFRAEGGDDHSMPWRRVEVVEPPQLESLSITVHPPAYAGRSPAEANRHLEVLEGTGIEASGVADEPLRAARIVLDNDKSIQAKVSADAAGKAPRSFRIEPDQWIARDSGHYRLELTDTEGVSGIVGEWNLRVATDTPPRVEWQFPQDDLYVTPEAVLPIAVTVRDNLAIRSVDLTYDRSDWSEAERERVAGTARIELYAGAEKPPTFESGESARGERRVVEHAWDLRPLDLPAGAELTILAEAVDYRPGIGRTVRPRRISIVTPDEMDARLAELQSQIVRQLQRALEIELATREDVRHLEIQHRDAGSVGPGDRNTLQTALLNQNRVTRTLVDDDAGVPALVDMLRQQIEMNRLERNDLHQIVDELASELSRLENGPLDAARAAITAAQQAVETASGARESDDRQELNLNPEQSALLAKSLAAAGAAQEEVITSLEKLLNKLGEKADYRRLVRLLNELRQDQLAHTDATRQDIGVETLPLRLNELSSAQRAMINKAAAAQSALAARFEKIEQALDQLAQQPDIEQEVRERLSSAVRISRSLAIAAKMEGTARDLSENRIGGALSREVEIAGDLQQVLDVLRGGEQRRPEQLAGSLRQAEQRLAALRQKLASLRQEIERLEQAAAGATADQPSSDLAKRQDALRQEIEKLSQQLKELEARDASQTAQQAAERLEQPSRPQNQAQESELAQNETERPSSSTDVTRAEQDLEKAAEQLAARRQQAEDDLALEIVRRFQAELTEMVERQRKVIDETATINQRRGAGKPDEAAAQQLSQLAAEERELAGLAKEHSEMLVGLGAVHVSLEEAQRRLDAAAELLESQQSGQRAQQAEQLALARLKGMMEAFAQTASEAAPDPAAQPPAGQGGQGQPPRRPTFELLEIKMLRMLQVDLHERTQKHQQRVAQHDGPLDDEQRAELEREAADLAVEQGQLAELVQSMLTRDNEQSDE